MFTFLKKKSKYFLLASSLDTFYLPFFSYSNHSKNKKLADLWLDHIEIYVPHLKREYPIPNTKFYVDGYDEKTKTVYEFQGDFWHGNPNVYRWDKINPLKKYTYGELYEKTLERKKILEKLGYKYIEIWESEFNHIYKKS